MKKLGMTFGMLASLAFLIHGCGGGGGGGGSTPTAATKSAAKASSKAAISALNVGSLGTALGGAGLSPKPALKVRVASNLSDEARMRYALKAFNASLAGRQSAVRAPFDSGDEPCSGGGTQRVQSDDNGSFTITYHECVEGDDSASEFLDGVISLALTNQGLAFTFTNFVSRATDAEGTDEGAINGTMNFTGTPVSCGDTSFLENGTFKINLTVTEKVDRDGTSGFEVNETTVLNNVTMNVTEAHGPEPGCEPGKTTFVMNGKSTLTDHVDATRSLTATFTNFSIETTPAKKTIGGVEKDGDIVAMNGTIKIAASCITGTFTISTPAGEEPFIPEDGDCPVDGRFLVAGGGTTTTVIFTENGIDIDEGNDGTTDEHFDDCEQADICS